ncbi:MAG TPA: hypothetical protein PKW98_10715, partial [Candidatus Wallbacteria bacterium]|nr:hypothetical protein [Candidatus Wallbacteria bacterium]
MKFNWLISIAIAVILIYSSAAGAASMDKRIFEEFKKRGDQSRVSAIFRLKSQVVFKSLPREAARANYVKRALENHARISQRSIIDFIKSLGKDVSYESLWITNALVVTCDRATLDLLSARE